MNEVIATLEEIVESLKDGLPVNEVLASLRGAKLPGCEVEYQSGFVGEGRPSYPYFEIRTSHPKLDYVHYVEYDLLLPMSAEDKKELGEHLIVVLNAWLRELRRTPAKPKKSRQQPDSEVTKWVRKNWHKYNYKYAETVRKFIETHGKSQKQYKSLYAVLMNDLRKKPLQKPKKRQ